MPCFRLQYATFWKPKGGILEAETSPLIFHVVIFNKSGGCFILPFRI